MSLQAQPRLSTPVKAAEQPEPVRRPSTSLHSGVRLTIRGRTVRLRGIPAPRSGVLAFLAILGPGLIAATAGDDAGGIATYSQVGAKYGRRLHPEVLRWIVVIVGTIVAIVLFVT